MFLFGVGVDISRSLGEKYAGWKKKYARTAGVLVTNK